MKSRIISQSHYFFEKTNIVVFTVLILTFLSSYFAAIFFRPEFMDGSYFIAQGLNVGISPNGYPNHRTLFDFLYFPFYLMKWLPNEDIWFLPQRLLLNIWVAILPIILTGWLFLILRWQRRTYLAPWLILILTLNLLFLAGYHESMLSETMILAVIFCLLATEESNEIPNGKYVGSLFLSSLVVTGYEALIPIFLIGILTVSFRLLKQPKIHFNWRTALYLMVSHAMIIFLIYRFRNYSEFQFGQFTNSSYARLFFGWNLYLAMMLGIFGFFAIGLFSNRPGFGLVILGLGIAISFIALHFSFNFHFSEFKKYNVLIRFPKIYASYFLVGLFFSFSRIQLVNLSQPFLKWSFFIFLVFWVHDWQNTFMPKSVPMNCMDLNIPYDQYCHSTINSTSGRPNFSCFETRRFFPVRFSFDKAISKVAPGNH